MYIYYRSTLIMCVCLPRPSILRLSPPLLSPDEDGIPVRYYSNIERGFTDLSSKRNQGLRVQLSVIIEKNEVNKEEKSVRVGINIIY